MADVSFNPASRCLTLLAGEDVVSVDFSEVFQELTCIGVCVGIDWSGGDLVWSACCGRSDRDCVN